MSSIKVIKQSIKPWYTKGGQPRYYVNDWVDRIYDQLNEYIDTNPKCHSIESIAKWAKVWYDPNGVIHVDGLYDLDLTNYIMDTMEQTQFLDSEYDPMHGSIEVPWTKLIEDVPRRDEGFAAVFTLDGREFWVDMEFLAHEKFSNKAYILEDGTFFFESESSDLTELVLELMNWYASSDQRTEFTRLFPFIIDTPFGSSYQTTKQRNGREWTDGTGPKYATTSCLFSDDPERERVLESSKENKVRKEPRKETDHQNTIQTTFPKTDLEEVYKRQAEETRYPMSRWSKAIILETCEDAGIPERSMDILKGMTLKGIQTRFLVYDGTDVTGNDYDSSQQRHTKFWRLDFDAIRSL